MSEIAKSLGEGELSRLSMNRIIKLSVLALLQAAAITLVWWLIQGTLYGHQPLIHWVWVGLAAMVWCSFAGYFAITNPYRWAFIAANAWSLVAYILIMPKDLYVTLGGVVFFILSFLFQQRIASEEKNQLHFSIRRSISASILLATYGFMAVIGFNVYHYSSEDFQKDPKKYYSKVSETAVKGIPFISENFSGVNLNQSLDSYLFEKAKSQLPEDSQNSELLQQSAFQEYRAQFIKQFGLNSTENETVASAITKIIDQQSEDFLSKYSRFLPLIFALAIFGLLRTFAFIFNWTTIFFSWLLFSIMLKLRFFRIGKATVEVDRLEV